MVRTLTGVLFLGLYALAAHAVDEKKLVDLTYPFSAETHHWPTAKPFHLEKVSEGRTPTVPVPGTATNAIGVKGNPLPAVSWLVIVQSL